MLIDWFTVAAQLINFLILVWLLKRFLYKPILDAIDAREARIAAELADADRKRAQARQERDEFLEKNRAFDEKREMMLSQAASEANAERRRMLDEARASADELRSRRHEALSREQRALGKEVIRRTQEEVFAIARKALTDLAGSSLEAEITSVFIKQLQGLDDTAKKDFAGTSDANRSPMIVRSAFDLLPEQRIAIQDAVNEAFSVDNRLTFETLPDVISGIELTSGGRKISWSIADYLTSMEQRMGELLQGKTVPEESSLQEKSVV